MLFIIFFNPIRIQIRKTINYQHFCFHSIFPDSLEEDCVDFQGNTIAHGLLYVPGEI